jgi:hypothetical protein
LRQRLLALFYACLKTTSSTRHIGPNLLRVGANVCIISHGLLKINCAVALEP